MLLGSLGDVCVVDQAAEKRGHLRSDVQLFLQKMKEREKKRRTKKVTILHVNKDLQRKTEEKKMCQTSNNARFLS